MITLFSPEALSGADIWAFDRPFGLYPAEVEMAKKLKNERERYANQPFIEVITNDWLTLPEFKND